MSATKLPRSFARNRAKMPLFVFSSGAPPLQASARELSAANGRLCGVRDADNVCSIRAQSL
eukprot:scaffold526_cov230-Pinguiococcus_pyrenoidosus.AAC.12